MELVGVKHITEQSNRSTDVIRVLAAEDFVPYRQFVTSLLHERPTLRVVCKVGDGLEAVQKATELKPDLIMMDISLPGINGMEAARQILNSMPDSKIVFLTQESSPEIVQEAVQLGARGYVFKSYAESDLLLAVEMVLKGKQFFSRRTSGTNSDGNGDGR